MINIGDIVEWESQAQGVWKTKRGRVLAIVLAFNHILRVFPGAKEIPQARRKWSDWVSENDRAIVEVPMKSGMGSDFYAPRLSMLRKCGSKSEQTTS